MPRIDPVQLLRCLSVLLAPNGGIKSLDEVSRLAKLMHKFSKKLVSKCIYIQILKCTERELLGQFMETGGWHLVHVWLTESIANKNWALVQELLELFLLCPVTIERLKLNNCPKLIKSLTKEEGSHDAINALATKLVDNWLKIVKNEAVPVVTMAEIPLIILENKLDHNEDATFLLSDENKQTHNVATKQEPAHISIKKEEEIDECDANVVRTDENIVKQESKMDVVFDSLKKEEQEVETLPILKITVKNGKQVIMKVDDSEIKEEKIDKENKSSSKSSTRSSSKSSSKSSSSSKHSSSSSKLNDRQKSSSSSKSKSKSKDQDDTHKEKNDRIKKDSKDSSSSKEKDRHKHADNERLSSNKNKSESSDKSREKSKSERSRKDDKERKLKKAKEEEKTQEEKNKETLEKLLPMSIHKLGKIPKKTEPPKKEPPSMSIEVRKPDEPKPRTVKVFNSKMRSHGLENEAKPPPPRGAILKKPPPPLPPTVALPKRASPLHSSTEPPPEKKPKTVEPIEKPGSIKLIPPKPKPAYLLESDMFMDALNAATSKKEPRKRKRRTSGSKDGPPGSELSPPGTPTSTTSPTKDTSSTPFKFYKDTLDEDEKEISETKEEEPAEKSPKNEGDKIVELATNAIEEEVKRDANGLKSVLCIRKKKGPKKTIKWKPDNELEEIQYFELDETERTNVSKTFTDMRQLERCHERESVQKARNLLNDFMEEKTSWRRLIPIKYEGAEVEYGKNSKEKDIQANRQKSILQSLYFNKAMIPDSPAEADLENHQYTEPTVIPLEDITGNPDSINDYRNTPWPEPKEGICAPITHPASVPVTSIFPPAQAPFNPTTFPNPQFSMGFPPGPNIPPPDWPGTLPNGPMMGPNMLGMGMGPGIGPPPGMMPPNAHPPDGIMQQMFPVPMGLDGFIGEMNGMPPPNMFGPGFGGPMNQDPNHFNNFRGNMRGRVWRGGNGGGGPIRGRGGMPSRGARPCIHFQKRGSCRNGDKCGFLHIGVHRAM